MRGGAVLAMILVALSGSGLAAQTPPPAPPDLSQAPRPQPKPQIPEASEAPAPPADKPAVSHDGLAAKGAPAASPALDYSTGTPVDDQPKAAPDAAPAAPEQPLHTSLRESDFDYSACLLMLHTLGTSYAPEAAITEADNRDCGIDRPVRITEILPGITLQGAPVMRCDTARHLAFWLKDFVQPASRLLPGAPRLREIAPGSTYQCRGVVGNQTTANVSEHALGNAFDIAALIFDDGQTLSVAPRQDSGDMTEAFQAAIRGTACMYFTTVLGPGSNAAHDDHLHLDIKVRKNGYRLCQ